MSIALIGTALSSATVAAGAMTEIYSLGKALKEKGGVDINFNELKDQALSISQKAKKSVMVYPVLISASIGDIAIASDISKFLEIQYGIFTLLALGISTDITSKKASDVLKVVSAENLFLKNSISIGDSSELSQEVLDQTTEDFKEYIFKNDNSKKPRIGKNFSFEGIIPESKDRKENKDIKYQIQVLQFEIDRLEKLKIQTKDSIERKKELINELEKKTEELKKREDKLNEINLRASNQVEVSFITKLLSIKAEPTIINIETLIGTTKIKIPIAIKSALHPIKSDEMRMILESGIEGRLPTLRIAKALSGEIRLIQDLIFQMDLAERDKELYKIMGRHPWFRKLQKRKASFLANQFKKVAGSSGKMILPTTSLIVTKEDLTLSIKLDYKHFLKNQELINGLLNSMFLISLGIYDPEMGTIAFFFSGFKDPFIYTLSELSKSGRDPNSSLFDAVKELSRKI